MEFDLWLFQLLEQKKISNALRIYEWENPTITYGKFQKIDEKINKSLCKKDRIDLVKRPTGGRAILHFREITFSLVIAPESLKEFNFKNTFLFTADRLKEAFTLLKIGSHINLKPNRYQEKSICFQSAAQYEILDDQSGKLTGIAQYFTKNGVLIQGSIPLQNDPDYFKYFKIKKTFELSNSLIKKNPGKEAVREALIKGFSKKISFQDPFLVTKKIKER
ncbi:MAG: hypothetical protein KKH98_01105 [Spirochaetes bacterium]|nr:hypothetical protein [Spirochaetota bacterium]